MTAPAPTLTVAEFIEARLAEDEAVARAARGEPANRHCGDDAAEESWRMAKAEGCAPEGYRFHRTHDPARVLAQVAALRPLVADHAGWHVCEDGMAGEVEDWDGNRHAPCDVLRALARIWADHEAYRAEWA